MDDVDLSIAHLARPDGLLLEVFRYRNAEAAALEVGAGNDMEQVGVKHVAFDVDDVAAVRSELVRRGHEVTEIRRGRGGFDFCFVADPDGMWVEILQDASGALAHRSLHPLRRGRKPAVARHSASVPRRCRRRPW